MRTEINTKPGIPALTGLRFIAAAAIVLNHTWPVVMKLNPAVPYAAPFVQLAQIGMSLFFVLSGFIIHYNYAAIVRTARGLYKFAVARFSRLYPLFFALIILDLFWWKAVLHAPADVRTPAYRALPFMLTGTQSWFYGFIGDHPIAFPYHLSHVAWSISTEFFLYIAYPLICVAAIKAATTRKAIWAAVLTCLGATVIIALAKTNLQLLDQFGALLGVRENPNANPGTRFSDWLTYISPYGRIPEFVTGVMIAQLLNVLPGKPSQGEKFLAPAMLFGCSAYALAFVFRHNLGEVGSTIGTIGLLPAIAGAIFCCARYRVQALETATIVALGEASYSMYLLHIIVIEKMAPTVFVDPTFRIVAGLTGRIFLICGIVVVLSLAVHRFFEMPAQKWLRRGLAMRRPQRLAEQGLPV